MIKGPKENTVEDYLANAVERQLGGYALKGDIKGRRFLDRIVILPRGITVWCECKRPNGGRYSRHQLETAERLVNRDHFFLFVNTKPGVDRALELLRCALKENASTDAIHSLALSCLQLSRRPSPGVYFIGPSSLLNIWEVLPHD